MAYSGMATTFRTVGQAALGNHGLFSIENLAGSSVTVYVRRLLVQLDGTGALTTFMPQIKTYRFATPGSAGTTLAKGTFDSAQASSTLVQVRGATASDGGAAVTLGATNIMGTLQWQQSAMRLQTQVGQVLGSDNNLLPLFVDDIGDTDSDYVLLAGEGLMVQVWSAYATANPNTNHWFVSCVWQEV